MLSRSCERIPPPRRRVPVAELLQADATRLPFDAEFAAVGAFDVIEHIVDDAAVLHEIRRCLQPRGTLVLTVPQHHWLWSGVDVFAHHQRRYTRAEIRARLSDAGFEIELTTGFTSLLLPLMYAARLRSGGRQRAPEVALPRLLDSSMSAVMAVERSAIRAGARFPFGGSLLVAARRRD